MARAAARPKGPRFSRQAPEQRRQEIVAAAVACLAKGGAAAFTVSEIAKTAGTSHGLINHYFKSKEDLLVAAYKDVGERLATATRQALARIGRSGAGPIRAVVETSFSPDFFNETNLSVWLALWGQVRNDPALRLAHNALYDGYRRSLARSLEALAKARGRKVDPQALARAFTALIDGLWLEWCLNPAVFSPDDAKALCYDLLEARLGDLRTTKAGL